MEVVVVLCRCVTGGSSWLEVEFVAVRSGVKLDVVVG